MSSFVTERGNRAKISRSAWSAAARLLADATKAGMGHRSRRFALVIRDGTVLHAAVDAPMQTHVSTADALLRQDVLAKDAVQG